HRRSGVAQAEFPGDPTDRFAQWCNAVVGSLRRFVQQLVKGRRLDVDTIYILKLTSELGRLAKCRYSDTAESDRRHYLARQAVALFEQIEQLPPVFRPGTARTACAVHVDLEHVPYL